MDELINSCLSKINVEHWTKIKSELQILYTKKINMRYLRLLMTLCPTLLLGFIIDFHISYTLNLKEDILFLIMIGISSLLIGWNLGRIHRWIWDNDDFK